MKLEIMMRVRRGRRERGKVEEMVGREFLREQDCEERQIKRNRGKGSEFVCEGAGRGGCGDGVLSSPFLQPAPPAHSPSPGPGLSGGQHAKPSVYLHHSELAVNSTP